MKNFEPRKDICELMRDTAKVINDNSNKLTKMGLAYFEALAKQRARLDAKRGNHDINDRSIPESYRPYYRKAYAEMWDIVIDELSKDENGQKNSNS